MQTDKTSDTDSIRIHPIARFKSPFSSKFGIPRQSGIIEELGGRIVFLPEFRREEALRLLDGFDYLWIIWGFSANAGKWGFSVRPPRLGGNRQAGVFASRSPFRPNGLGLSSVRLLGIDTDCEESPQIIVGGADLMDGTPIYDIKPYIKYTDSHPEAHSGYTDSITWEEADVIFPEKFKKMFLEKADNADSLDALIKALAQRPMPQYIHNPDRIYGMPFSGVDVKFRYDGNNITVCGIENINSDYHIR